MFQAPVALSQDTMRLIHHKAARSIFWEIDAETATRVRAKGDPSFEKEAWLATTLMNYGCCGFSISRRPAERAIATVIYCSPHDAPGASQLPTAPVSPDAQLVSSLFIDPGFAGVGLEAVLLDSAIMELVEKDASAVEAFGWREEIFLQPNTTELIAGEVGTILAAAPDIGLMTTADLESAGFKVVADHPVLPRLRLELPPQRDLLSAADIALLLASVEAR